MAQPIPHQSTFLYPSNWTPALDSTLLHTLMRLKREHGWDGTVLPRYFFVEAQHLVEEEMGYMFEWEELYDRLHFLERRYKTFNAVLRVHGTSWNCDTNSIVVDDRSLEPLLKVDPLAAAYYRRGEPAFAELTLMFGFEKVKQEKRETVINISESPIENNVMRRAKHTSIHENLAYGEVQSEYVTRARCKLFVEDENTADQMSTNAKAARFCRSGGNAEFTLKHANVGPSCPLSKPPRTIASPYGSSCASSSPVMWWREREKK